MDIYRTIHFSIKQLSVRSGNQYNSINDFTLIEVNDFIYP